MRNAFESMRLVGLLAVLIGCGGDAAKPATSDDDDDGKSPPMSSCGDGDKCVTAPERDAGTTPRLDAGNSNPSPSANDAGTTDASTADASKPDASLAICPLEDNEDVCSTCLKFSCCEEIIECGPECQELVQCANKCPSTSTTDACAQRCFEQHAAGMAAFTAFAGCVGVQCEEACSSSN